MFILNNGKKIKILKVTTIIYMGMCKVFKLAHFAHSNKM